MDRAELRRRALLAAATVTMAFACQGDEDAKGGPITDTPTDTPVDTDAPADSPADTDAPADSPADTDAPADSPVDTDAPDSDTPETDPPVAQAGEPDCATLDLTACCEQRQAWCGAQHDPASEDYAACVWGPGYDGSTGCIPWGPPVPPRMRVLA